MSDFTPTPTPSYSGKLRNHMLMVPECINECSGIRIFGRTIKSFVFSTDVATIASVNADAGDCRLSLYPAAAHRARRHQRGGYARVLRRRRRLHVWRALCRPGDGG